MIEVTTKKAAKVCVGSESRHVHFRIWSSGHCSLGTLYSLGFPHLALHTPLVTFLCHSTLTSAALPAGTSHAAKPCQSMLLDFEGCNRDKESHQPSHPPSLPNSHHKLQRHRGPQDFMSYFQQPPQQYRSQGTQTSIYNGSIPENGAFNGHGRCISLVRDNRLEETDRALESEEVYSRLYQQNTTQTLVGTHNSATDVYKTNCQ